ncbi:hypothetical protein HYQ46_007737 [Verticillium longisporum]|nr:hypothetical protein HYQ46_007737 [Verticillium longisporum]
MHQQTAWADHLRFHSTGVFFEPDSNGRDPWPLTQSVGRSSTVQLLESRWSGGLLGMRLVEMVVLARRAVAGERQPKREPDEN